MKKIYLFDNAANSMLYKNKIRKEKEVVVTDIEVSTLDFHVLSEVKIYWTLVSNTTFPVLIQRDISIAILYRIIEERRIFDSYFNDVNSNNMNLAREIYNIMLKSSKSKIPVDAISQRILKFKKGRKNSNVFIDLQNVIIEYESILDKYNLVDLHRAYDIYFNKLLKDDVYNRLHEYDEIKMNNLELKRNYVSNISNVFDYTYENYSDMKSGIIELLNELVNEKNVKEEDICIIVPNYNDISKRFFEGLNYDLNIPTSYISNSISVKKIDIVNLVLIALSIKCDCIHLFNDDEKFEFIRFFSHNVGFLELKEQSPNILAKLRNELILEKYSKIDDNAEFIKTFFIDEIMSSYTYKEIIKDSSAQIYFRAIDAVADLFKEFLYIERISEMSFTIDFKLKYIMDNISYFIGNREKLEKSVIGGISVITIDDYYNLEKSCRHKIVFDSKSSLYDFRSESELNTEIAYLDDDILSNLNEDNISDFYRDFEIDKIDEKIMKLFNDHIDTDVYVFSSDKSVRGFDQQSSFYNRLFYLLRKV